jgi:8-oxo-dGTP diphosphatase
LGVRLLRPLRTLLALIPDIPRLELGSGPIIPQAVVLRDAPNVPGGAEVLLLLRTSPRAWEFPGGALERGEAPEEAVVRETLEETGLDVEVERLVGWYRRPGFVPHRSPVYVCRATGGRIRSNFESVRVAWFPVDVLPEALFPWYIPIVRDAVAGVSHSEEQVQRLGVRSALAALRIHVRGILSRGR